MLGSTGNGRNPMFTLTQFAAQQRVAVCRDQLKDHPGIFSVAASL